MVALIESTQAQHAQHSEDDFISRMSLPVMKIAMIDERLSGDTGGTKAVLEVPLSKVVDKAQDSTA